jgi:hypothetical protein
VARWLVAEAGSDARSDRNNVCAVTLRGVIVIIVSVGITSRWCVSCAQAEGLDIPSGGVRKWSRRRGALACRRSGQRPSIGEKQRSSLMQGFVSVMVVVISTALLCVARARRMVGQHFSQHAQTVTSM